MSEPAQKRSASRSIIKRFKKLGRDEQYETLKELRKLNEGLTASTKNSFTHGALIYLFAGGMKHADAEDLSKRVEETIDQATGGYLRPEDFSMRGDVRIYTENQPVKENWDRDTRDMLPIPPGWYIRTNFINTDDKYWRNVTKEHFLKHVGRQTNAIVKINDVPAYTYFKTHDGASNCLC